MTPMTVLDPDLGMDTEIFAKVRSSSVVSTRATSRLSGLDSFLPEENVNLDEALDAVTQALERVEKDSIQIKETQTYSMPDLRRHKGRRVRPGLEDSVCLPPDSANSETDIGV